MIKKIISFFIAICVLISVFIVLPVQAATPPTPTVTISSPSNTTITLGQSFTISGSGTNCHHICGFVNGSAQATQNGNSYGVSYKPSSIGTYSVYIAGRNTANSTDPGTKLATSATRTVTVVAPTGTITVYSTTGATISGQLNGTININGYCSWSNMAYGTYTFNVSKSGYNTSSNNSITLNSSSVSKTVNLTVLQTHVVKITAVNSANSINQTYTANGSKYSIQIYSDTLPTNISLSATDNESSTSVSPSFISLSLTSGDSDYIVSTAYGSLTFAVTIVKRASQESSIKWHTDHMHVYQVKDTNTGALTNVNFTLNVDSGWNAILDNAILGNMVPNVVAGHQYQIYYSRVIAITVNDVVQSPLRDCHVQSDVTYLESVFTNESSFSSYDGLYSFWTAPVPVPSVMITSPANGTIITLGQSLTIAGAGTNCHHICAFINGSAQTVQNGNSYSTIYTPTALGTYTVFLRGRNTANDTDSGTQTADSSTVTFKVNAPPTSITVNVKDKVTGVAISGASISGGSNGTTNSNGQVIFSGLSFGTYTFNASKAGYSPDSGSITINASAPDASITIYLIPIPVNGDITVTIKDSATNLNIPGVSVICGSSSGISNFSGVTIFSGLSFATYNVSASKSGYYSNTGSVSISVLTPNQSITIYLTKMPTADLTVSIQTWGDVRTDTDVIFNVIAYNTGETDIITSDNVKVSLTAVGTTQTVQLVVPQNSSQTIPFRVLTPGTSGTITLTAVVDSMNAVVEMNESNNTATKTVYVYKPVIPGIPDPKATDIRPAGWRVPPVPSTIADKRTTWTEWRYEVASQSFSRIQFYVDTRTEFTINPDPKIQTNKYISGEYITKSGYGVEAYMTVEVTTNYDRSGIITPAQRVWVYTPESDYSLFRDLELTLTELTTNAKLRSDKYSTYNARIHFTPLWYPDGYYTVYGKAMDIWTPAGEITTGYPSRVTIAGSVYDDWHIGPLY